MKVARSRQCPRGKRKDSVTARPPTWAATPCTQVLPEAGLEPPSPRGSHPARPREPCLGLQPRGRPSLRPALEVAPPQTAQATDTRAGQLPPHRSPCPLPLCRQLAAGDRGRRGGPRGPASRTQARHGEHGPPSKPKPWALTPSSSDEAVPTQGPPAHVPLPRSRPGHPCPLAAQSLL